MLSVFQTDVLLNELIRRVVFSAFTGTLWLLLGLGILRLLRAKNPAVKHVFYALVMAKSFISLVREQPQLVQKMGPINVALQFPNPSIVPDIIPEAGKSFFSVNSSIALGPGIVVLAATAVFLLWRFIALVRFQRIVSGAPELDRRTNSRVYEILDQMIARAKVVYPKVIALNSSATPFTVGFKRPIIALSPSMLNQLDQGEIEAVLAHEVAHVIRRDYLYHWPIVVMRDILFFNPLTYVVYNRLSFERERACDDFSSKLCRPLTLAKSLVKIAELRQTQPSLALVKSIAPQSFLSRSEPHLSRRVTALIEPKPYPALSRPRRAFLWLGAFMFLYTEIHIIAFINGKQVIFS